MNTMCEIAAKLIHPTLGLFTSCSGAGGGGRVIVTVSDGSNRGGNSNGIPETIGVRAGVWESTCEVSRSVFTAS